MSVWILTIGEVFILTDPALYLLVGGLKAVQNHEGK